MKIPRLGRVRAPELPKNLDWINSSPLTMAELRGGPVLIDFWTYSCVNCLRTIPHVEKWHTTYGRLGLRVIGVHSPEFGFEKDQDNVVRAVERLGITYPVVLDNDFVVWGSYANKYWPHLFLINHLGEIVYDHIGEGRAEETTHAIIHALQESGAKNIPSLSFPESPSGNACYRATPETYLGYLRGHIGNAGSALPETEEAFTDIEVHVDGVPYLHGHWRISSEYVEHTRSLAVATEYIRLKYAAFSLNLVLGALDDREAIVDVLLDGEPVPASMAGEDLVIDENGTTHLHVTMQRMYNIIRADHFHNATIKLLVKTAGLKFYAFTFSGCKE